MDPKMQGPVGGQGMEERPKRLLDQVRETIRVKHYSIRTEEAYVAWIKRYILFHNKRHPREMGVSEIEAFLTHLAVERPPKGRQKSRQVGRNQQTCQLPYLPSQFCHAPARKRL